MRLMLARPLASRPKVSVVIPCYNYGRYLRDCVGSALNNPGVDLEVIIVDDHSTDDSLATARAISSTDGRVRVIAHRVNKGHIETYNDGLSAVTGDYVVLLSADDLLTPGSLTRSAALFENSRDVTLVYGEPLYFSELLPAPSTKVSTWTVWQGSQWLRSLCRSGRNLIVNPEAMVRRETLERIGGYDPAHPHAADLKFWLEAATYGDVGRVNGVHQAFYRIHEANMHTTTFGGLMTDYIAVRNVFDAVLGGPYAPSAGPALLSAARKSMAVEVLRRAPLVSDDDLEKSLVQLALECDPHIRKTRHWGRYRLLVMHPAARRIGARAHEVRWKLRSRRWRLLGI